jgi:hypothetical protein
MVERPGRGSDQFALRLPAGLRERIKERADAIPKSMNQWLVDAIEDFMQIQDLRGKGWRLVEPAHQIDTGLLAELEAIAHLEEGNVPVPVSINSAISYYTALFWSDSDPDAWGDTKISGTNLATKEDLEALREEVSGRMERIERLLAELATKK